jgi:hypothetical protein
LAVAVEEILDTTTVMLRRTQAVDLVAVEDVITTITQQLVELDHVTEIMEVEHHLQEEMEHLLDLDLVLEGEPVAQLRLAAAAETEKLETEKHLILVDQL